MRRVNHLWQDIVSFEALRRAALRAARGKRCNADVARFLADLEPEVLRLQAELCDGTWRPGRAHCFDVHDPKRRTITAAPFADRVVHHALMDRLKPLFDRRMIPESFACRRGKGSHRALTHARRMLREHEWFLKLDVRRCFDSLDHDVVLATVARVVKDRRVLDLCATIVRHGSPVVRHGSTAADGPSTGDRASPTGTRGVGLPIGNLTSQWFCNLLLDRLDHHVKEVLRMPGYVRYMDDFVLFADDKPTLRTALAGVETFLGETLRLSLKSRDTLLAPARQGLPFLGWRIHRGTTRLRRENVRRAVKRLRLRAGRHRQGRIDDESFAACVRSLAEHLRHGNTLRLRRALFARILPGDRSFITHRTQGDDSQAPATA